MTRGGVASTTLSNHIIVVPVIKLGLVTTGSRFLILILWEQTDMAWLDSQIDISEVGHTQSDSVVYVGSWNNIWFMKMFQ